MATNFEKLKRLLEELFQLDQADLDFGIYRIMNQKRDEIVEFLDKKLLPQVQEAFSEYKSADKAELQEELDAAIQAAKDLGVDPESTTKVKELREKYDSSAVDVTLLENEVFSHLYNFFRRYYHEGDFISQRRYKEGVYAIPYEGEEVKLHWANHDQYYIKSGEYFRDYIFTVSSGKRVRVHLVAASSEQGNKKEASGKERRFIICEDNPLYEENGELFIRFEYRSEDGQKKQPALNEEAIKRVLSSKEHENWIVELAKPAPTKAKPKRTILEKHLNKYTARNTFDYFIHKDLGGFLSRELDFFIKNEILHLEDIESESVNRVAQYLSKVRVVRRIALKVVAFLTQLEDFQRRLWTKQKFVVQVNYCFSLDRVPVEMYREVAQNESQQDEWVRLCKVDQIEKDLNTPAYQNPPTIEYLKANPHLVVDTKHFSPDFKDRLLASIDDLCGELSGTLIKGDNFHALNLLNNTFNGNVRAIYIDPPYNTGEDDFVYKDNYQFSSWVTMMADRARAGVRLLDSDGLFYCSLDDRQSAELKRLFAEYTNLTRLGEFIWKTRNTDNRVKTCFSVDHESIHVFAKPDAAMLGRVIDRSDFKNPDDDPRGPYTTDPLTGKANAVDRPNLHYLIENPSTGDKYPPQPDFGWITNERGFEELLADNRIHWPSNPKTGQPRKKRFLSETNARAPISSLGISITQGEGNRDLAALFGEKPLNFPKPVSVIRSLIDCTVSNGETFLDFFAGSGSSGQAAVQLIRSSLPDLKFVLVEMADYFDTIVVPRMKKVCFSEGWEDGAPTDRAGTSIAFRCVYLESYEDALSNLKELKSSPNQRELIKESDDLEEQYILSYMLDVESRGSQSLLNVDGFRNPDEYKLKVEKDGETQLVNVDLVETFNWLLGLTVKHIDVIRGVRVVEGTNPEGDHVLILWRNIDETDNDALDKWFAKQDYNTKEQVYDIFYINGDNNIENLRRPDQTWKVRLIEEEFQRLMFDVEDV